MNANSHFGTLRYPLICTQSCLLMSLIIWTTNKTGDRQLMKKVLPTFTDHGFGNLHRCSISHFITAISFAQPRTQALAGKIYNKFAENQFKNCHPRPY